MLLATPALAGVDATLRPRKSKPGPGEAVIVDVRVQWEGRPEAHLVDIPKLDVPRGAVTAAGGSRSSFSGGRTTWVSEVVVTLPDSGGPWTLGPAHVGVVDTRKRQREEIVAPAVVVGRLAPWKRLAGEALGSGAFLALALGWFGWRWRSLAPEQTAADAGSNPVDALLQARGPGWQQAVLQALVGTDHPDADAIRVALDGIKYGGELPAEADIERWATAGGDR